MTRLTSKELKVLKAIDSGSGKVKMTRYKNVYDYLKHLDEDETGEIV